jgi:formate--tetrahydrofolate ligase
VVFTEAGFGFDLGAEKFLDITCRAGGFWPHAIVLVVTLRALKVHGGVAPAASDQPDRAALERGMAHLDKHLENVRAFGVEPTVMVNVRAGDAPGEIQLVVDRLRRQQVDAAAADVFSGGGAGALEIAELVVARARAASPRPTYLYELTDPPAQKIRRVATTIYGAEDVVFSVAAKKQLDQAASLGFGGLPICIAKTHLSLSDNEKLVGRPRDFEMTVRELRIAAGAGFLVPLAGEVLTMPGLPKRPHAADIDLRPDGTIVGVE